MDAYQQMMTTNQTGFGYFSTEDEERVQRPKSRKMCRGNLREDNKLSEVNAKVRIGKLRKKLTPRQQAIADAIADGAKPGFRKEVVEKELNQMRRMLDV
jgi:hypothetical protein